MWTQPCIQRCILKRYECKLTLTHVFGVFFLIKGYSRFEGTTLDVTLSRSKDKLTIWRNVQGSIGS